MRVVTCSTLGKSGSHFILLILSQEDLEDIWIFGFMVNRFLLIEMSGYLFYQKMEAVLEPIQKLKDRAAVTEILSFGELAGASVVIRKVLLNLEKLSVRLGGNGS